MIVLEVLHGAVNSIRRRRALRNYMRELGPLLVHRYGRDSSYTIGQILTTLRVHRLDQAHAQYACAMYSECSQFVNWMDDELAARVRDNRDTEFETYRSVIHRPPPPSEPAHAQLWSELRDDVARRFPNPSVRTCGQRRDDIWLDVSRRGAGTEITSADVCRA